MNKSTSFTVITAVSLLGALALSGCSGSSSGGGNSSSSAASSGVVTIDAMTTVPVINGTATKGTLYIHNYSNTTATGLHFGVDKETKISKLSQLLATIGVKSTASIVASNGFTINNPEICASIPAGGSCAINFTTPNLTLANRDNTLVTLDYKLDNKTLTTNQVVNYQYTSLSAIKGVNFTGSLAVSGKQGETRHVVGYLYGGGSAGSKYSNVNLKSSVPTTTISGGFINGQEVAAGQVIAVEYAVALQNDKTGSVNVTPSWGSVVNQKTKKSALAAGEENVGASFGITTLTPTQNTVNLVFGEVPILMAPTTSAATINVVNNGNAASDSSLAVETNNDKLKITNGCDGKVFAANGGSGNNCTIGFSVDGYTPGSATVTYKLGSAIVGTDTVIWTNDTPVPAVYIVPSTSNTSFGKGQNSSNITFTVYNIGKAPLLNTSFSETKTGPATWNMANNSCSATLAPGAEPCVISGTLHGTDDGVGKLYYTASGDYNSTNYNFVSLPLNYEVSAAPSLSITPTGVHMTLLANDESSVTEVFAVTNKGNDPALFSALNLAFPVGATTPVPAPVKPAIITGDTTPNCTAETTLAEAGTCYVTVKYGKAPINLTANESGSAAVNIDYHGGTPDTPRNVQDPFTYNLVGNDSTVTVGTPTASNLTGSGTQGNPFSGNSSLDPMTVTISYSNPSVNYAMGNFNLNTNKLPLGVVVDTANTTCPTGSTVGSIAMGESCNLVLKIDRSILETSGQGGSNNLNFTEPTATWTTPLGFYSQAGSQVYMNYSQPTLTFTLSANNGGFASTDLTVQATNMTNITSLTANVSGVSKWLETLPTAISPCTVNASDYSASCTFTTNNQSGSITYTMPTYLQIGQKADIPLMFSTAAGEYAFLSPSYTFINYEKVLLLSFFAGNGLYGTPTVGPALNSKLYEPRGVAVDKDGNVYIADSTNNRIEKVDTSGNLTFVAGNGTQGAAVEGPAMDSPLYYPTGVAVDKNGNVYIADYSNNRVEKVDPNGNLTFVAGNGSSGDAVQGPAINSPLKSPSGVAIDSAGNVYIADYTNNRVEKVDPDGNLTFVAGVGGICTASGAAIEGPATSSPLCSPFSVAVDSLGNVYIADSFDNRIEKVAPNGNLTFFAGNGTQGAALEGPATSSALYHPYGVTVDSMDNVYIADSDNNRIEKVDPSGNLAFFAGNGIVGSSIPGPAMNSPLKGPRGVAVDSVGRVYIADTYNERIEKVQ